MAISPDCNFVFLDEEYPFLAQHACIAESCVYSDPHTCIMKIGLLNEELCRIICNKFSIEIKKKDNFAKIVHKLKKYFFTDEDADTCIKIEEIAKSRNKAAHNLPRSEAEQGKYIEIAKYSLKAGFAVSKNFYSRFVNSAYEFPSFHMPGQVAVTENARTHKVTSKPHTHTEKKEPKTEESSCSQAKKSGAIAATAVGAGLLLGPLGLPIIGALAAPLAGQVVKGLGTGSAVVGAVALGAKAIKAAGIMPDSVNSFFSALDLSALDKDTD